jgi:SAM-dependent methyltransferase
LRLKLNVAVSDYYGQQSALPLPNLLKAAAEGFPDLRPFFRHTQWRTTEQSKGALVCSDFTDKAPDDPIFGIYKQCGFWTVDEVKILFAIAKSIGGYWLDIGGLTGWTAAHMVAAGCHVAAVDPMYSVPGFRARAVENLTACGGLRRVGLWPLSSNELFLRCSRKFSGIVIDGDHETPHPLEDAINAVDRVVENGAILFHDTNMAPVQPGYKYLKEQGWQVRLYKTTHGVAVCYRTGFAPAGVR